ncbi:hypothetical protein NEMBOFW57_008985 [Staphylotrichum longicolle]|uniref:Uncharacterized protein n=1 Tax=Staphylotrichum longicolle TaxID=669026 RepID=A0AAD4EST7_9PEZI|nr:hypothetical protein NEMBOFW57_008985 [Staphylotrichum longicolle]
MVADPKGASSYYQYLYGLLERDLSFGARGAHYDPHGEFDTAYFCNDYHYEVALMPTTGYGLAYLTLFQHIGLIFPYNPSSRESWDEMAASFERMRSRCPDENLPFLATMIASVADMKGPRAVSHEEGLAFASQRGCRFVTFSPSSGRGVGDAVGLLVELAYVARHQFPATPPGPPYQNSPLSPADKENIRKRAHRALRPDRYNGIDELVLVTLRAPSQPASPALVEAVEKFTLAMSDQQLVTGLAQVIVATAMASGAGDMDASWSAYSYAVAVSLALFAALTHVSSLTILREHLRSRKKLRLLRVAAIVVFIALLLFGVVSGLSRQILSRPAYTVRCALSQPLPPGSWDAVIISQVLICLVLISAVAQRFWHLFGLDETAPFGPRVAWYSRRLLVEFLFTIIPPYVDE